jgi:hypothetical protein
MSRYNKLFLRSSREWQKEKEIFNQLNTAFDMIVMDPFCGIFGTETVNPQNVHHEIRD